MKYRAVCEHPERAHRLYIGLGTCLNAFAAERKGMDAAREHAAAGWQFVRVEPVGPLLPVRGWSPLPEFT